MSDLYNIVLPKWPAMVVEGESVTPEQAKEILVRTFSWMYTGNDNSFSKACLDAARIKYAQKEHWIDLDWDALQNEATPRLGLLPLEYLSTHLIHSAWIGGPHGWCDWSGRIGSSISNIGKWPSVEQVHAEWQTIAEAFPFLSLRCQLYSGETCEDHIYPLVEFVVAEGKAVVREPGEMTLKPKDPPSYNFFADDSEKGCSIETLREAIAITERSVAARSALGDP